MQLHRSFRLFVYARRDTVHSISMVVTLIKQRISSLKETRCLGNLFNLIFYSFIMELRDA